MQNDLYEVIVYELEEKLEEHFKDRIDSFVLSRQRNEPYVEFSLEFKLYNFYYLSLNYDRGRFGCSIGYGNMGISLENSQKWYDKADLNIFVKELDEEIRLRIPDKYLQKYGWL